jgi:hemolysin activation/secretion protein
MRLVNYAMKWMHCVLLCGSMVATTTFAQAPQVPAGAQPGQIDRQLQRLPEPTAPERMPPVVIPESPEFAPVNAEQIRVTLSRVEIAGNTVISTTVLLAPHLLKVGKEISLADVYAMAGEMTVRYRNAGYILSVVNVPAQTVVGGLVRLQVVEGYLSDVLLEGSGLRSGLFDEGRARLLAERPLRNASLERFLLLLNDLPGLQAQGVLRKSPSSPGASELVVKLGQSHSTLSASGNNRGSSYQGPTQYQAQVALNSIFGGNESTSVQYLQAQQSRELQWYSLSHSQRLTASGLEMRVQGSRSKSNPVLGEDAGNFTLETQSSQVRAEMSYPLRRSRASNVKTRLVASWHDGRTEIAGIRASADTITALRAGLTWDGTDSLGGVNILDLEFGKGITALGASSSGELNASRVGGNPQFSKATGYLARLQSLGGGFSMLVAVNGQVAFDNLLAPEEFAFGGDQFGRAYDSSELVGDSGAAGKLELRFTGELGARSGYTAYGFAERGEVSRKFDASESGGVKSEGATSLGIGLRMSAFDWLSGYVEAARPAGSVSGSTRKKETRVFGGLQVSFSF